MIGIVGLFVGALLGLILSPLLGMVLIRLMALHTPIGFMFSLSALMDVLTLMGVVYLLVGAINAIYVRSPLRQFIRQQDVPAPPKPQTRWRFWARYFWLFVVGRQFVDDVAFASNWRSLDAHTLLASGTDCVTTLFIVGDRRLIARVVFGFCLFPAGTGSLVSKTARRCKPIMRAVFPDI